MELERNYDEFFAIRAQKYLTKASRSIYTASNNLKKIDTDGYPRVTRDIVNSLDSSMRTIYRQIIDAETELIELRRALNL